jgi:surface antigen
LQFERGSVDDGTDFTAVTHTRLRWSWTTPANARGGKWRVFVVCALEDGETRELKRSLLVRGPKRGRTVVLGRVKVKQSGSQLREIPATPSPTAETAGNNTFPKGQCTYWGYEKRPDIYENSWTGDGFGWSARDWDDNARLTGGYVVDGQPRVGDIAVWEAGYRGAGQSGHVAYVEAVHEDGSIDISEMNYAGNHDVSTRVLDAETVRGLSFIHQR